VSDPTDIKALDEYLKGNSDISQRYRELGRDEVPPELDRRVLAAARDAVAGEGSRRSRSWLRWSAPVALAASVVLVVTVVLERGVQDQTVPLPQAAAPPSEVILTQPHEDAVSDDKAVVMPEPTVAPPVPAEPPEPSLAKVEADRPASFVPSPEVELAPPAAPAPAPIQAETLSSVAPQAGAVAPPAPATEAVAANKSAERKEEANISTDVSEVVITGRARRAPGRSVGPRETISSGAFTRDARPTADEQRERSDPQAWLEDIRAMRRAGKNDEADREWERFRAAFPNFQVADDDLARKK
jgi:hypothetical protein